MTRGVLIAKTLLKHIPKADTASYAAALSYNFLFALFPLLLFLAALLGVLHLPGITNFFRGPGSLLLAPNLKRLILRTITSARRFHSPTLLSLGALGFILSMSGAFRQLIDALNHAYGYKQLTRKSWKTYLLSGGLGILIGILLTLSEMVVTLGADVIRWTSYLVLHHHTSPFLSEVIRWGVLLTLMWIILTLIYNWLPDHVERFRWITPGTVLVMILWVLIALGFSFYAAHFNHYNLTYGSLGAVIFLMLYLYVLSFALLLGAELNAIWFTDESAR